MEAFAAIMLTAPVLFIAVLVLLALLVRGIRRADRTSLRNSSSNRLDAITRRVVGGSHSASRDGEDR